ncbi:unnamed protein product [Leptosia nina]|uniref:Uncharacterized protein n=1 Tax=Leptosia nina TaxID=320188 RepID=A0AAV1J5G0_9NEOP
MSSSVAPTGYEVPASKRYMANGGPLRQRWRLLICARGSVPWCRALTPPRRGALRSERWLRARDALKRVRR